MVLPHYVDLLMSQVEHAVANGRLKRAPPIHICHIFSTLLSVSGHWGCFQILAIEENPAVGMGVQVSLSSLLGKYPRVGLLVT